MKVKRVQTQHSDFKNLVRLLDEDLAITDGDEHSFYDQFNGLEAIEHALVVYDKENAIACGALKYFDTTTMEIKRMFTKSEFRGQGVGSMILHELEKWARELMYNRCVLETGKRQPDAIALYKKNGYTVIPNYGPYREKENSVCFQKIL